LPAEAATAAQPVTATAEASPVVYIYTYKAHCTYRDLSAFSGFFLLWNTVFVLNTIKRLEYTGYRVASTAAMDQDVKIQ
jgi:hypothetical protein